MFVKLVTVALCISFVACSDFVRHSLCANKTIFSDDVRMQVSGCDSTLTHCPLIRGTNHTVLFFLKPTEDFKSTTDFRVYGVFQDFSVPYGKRANACDGATSEDGTTCATLGGFLKEHKYKHTSTFAVSKNYPKIQLSVRFVFLDRRSKKHLLCAEVPVEIMDSPEAENEA